MLGGGRLIFLWTDAYTSMWSEIPSSIVVVFFFKSGYACYLLPGQSK